MLMLFASAEPRRGRLRPRCVDLRGVGRDYPNPHLAFGQGNHFCLGGHRWPGYEGRVVLDELLDRFAGVARVGPMERGPSSVVTGVRRAELRFVAA